MSNPHQIISKGRLCAKELEWAIKDTARKVQEHKTAGNDDGVRSESFIKARLEETLAKVMAEK
jgi:hypothetical protein